MQYRTTLLTLVGVLWSTIVLSQGEIRIDVVPTKISSDVRMIIPSGQNLVLETYHFFKYNYWIVGVDTLKELDNGMLQSKGFVLNPEVFKIKVSKCDTLINNIRNGALAHSTFSELRAMARKEIGYDNKEFNSGFEIGRPSSNQQITLCNDYFAVVINNWFTDQAEEIKKIKKIKTDRQEWIRSNPDKINRDFIQLFLEDFGSCDIDHQSILDLMINRTDDILLVCKDMEDLEFHAVKLKLYDLSDKLDIDKAIDKIAHSPIKTTRKNKLVSVLKKSRH
ncbi:MAG TPA: hypothetical protein VK658_24160 [Chryseolinea sp.]|nr:hypothetical protein [Chryseolinea sp.]